MTSIVSSPEASSCDLLIFPEMALTGFAPKDGLLTTEMYENCVSGLQSAALKYDCHIVFGVLACTSEDASALPANLEIVISNSGHFSGVYAKIYPFSMANEHLYTSPGTSPSLFQVNSFSFALSICYDLRFPELFSSIAEKVDCFVNIASWPLQRIDHWDALLKARAIENQAFVVGVNRSGIDGNNLEYESSSMVYSPTGLKLGLSQSIEIPELSCLEIDFNEVSVTRSSFPALRDRRPSVYPNLCH